MKIVNLIENTEGKNGFLCEHGLSFYIEAGDHKILLDTGASDAFLKNAEEKGIDLTKVDTAIISHGHYDHAGGVLAFTHLNPHARIYIHENARGRFYTLKHSEPKYIGMDPQIASLDQVVFLKGDREIDAGISLYTGVKGRTLWPKGNEFLKVKDEDEFLQDEFDHEQYLVIAEEGMRVLLSGCAHNGIINILDRFRELYGGEPSHVISGFHTTKVEYTEEDVAIIRATAEELAKMDTLFYSGHCTDAYPMQLMKEIMGEKLIALHSGDDIL